MRWTERARGKRRCCLAWGCRGVSLRVSLRVLPGVTSSVIHRVSQRLSQGVSQECQRVSHSVSERSQCSPLPNRPSSVTTARCVISTLRFISQRRQNTVRRRSEDCQKTLGRWFDQLHSDSGVRRQRQALDSGLSRPVSVRRQHQHHTSASTSDVGISVSSSVRSSQRLASLTFLSAGFL